MPVITLETRISATPAAVFDLSIDVDQHVASTEGTGERAVAGVTSGPLGLGDEVEWEAHHLGGRWRMRVRISEYDRPHRFVDEMVRGPFASMRHTHLFVPHPEGTSMIDEFVYRAPLGPLGILAEAAFLTRYTRRLLVRRNAHLTRVAESSRG